MGNRPLSYRTLQRDLWKRAIPYTFTDGHGGVVTFLGALGAGVLAAVYQMPALAGALGGVIVGLEALMAHGYLHGAKSRSVILRRALARRLDVAQLTQEPLRVACSRVIDIFVEIAAKVADTPGDRRAGGDLERVLAAACEMLALQYDAARRVEEYGRLLGLLERGPAGSAGAPAIAGLREQNLAAMKKLIADERQLVTDVGTQLETALLQVLQVSRGTAEAAKAAELAEQASETLHDFQAVVEARREMAELLRRALPASR